MSGRNDPLTLGPARADVMPTPLPEPPEACADLEAFCSDAFDSLPRADQRRCAQAYVHGLINAPGRRSTRRIALELAENHSDQSLQHFVNQSPWDHRPIRRRLAHLLDASLSEEGHLPLVWLIEEVAFNKNGRHSVGVAPQFAPSLGRVANIQFGATLMLAARRAAAPVDWRLHLPPSWDADLPRRRRAHIPDDIRHRPFWHSLVDMVDELTVRWGMSAAPVRVDLSGHTDADRFVDAMLDRDMDVVVRVGARYPVRPEPGARRSLALPEQGPLDELAALAVARKRRTVCWEQDGHRIPRSQFVTVAVDGGADASRRMLALVEWPYGAERPTGAWLTTLVGWPIEQLVQVAKLGWQSRHTLRQMCDDLGLYDYEGRSYPGWHHHVTLASAAHAFRLVQAPGLRAGASPAGSASPAHRDRLTRPGRPRTPMEPPRSEPPRSEPPRSEPPR